MRKLIIFAVASFLWKKFQDRKLAPVSPNSPTPPQH